MWSNRKDAALRERAAQVIPGGMYGHQSTALLPDDYPQFFERAEGARLWDADGNEYVDWMCAYGPNLLGYGHPEVQRAALDQMARGDAMTGPSPLIVELAEAFTAMVSHADWAIFCKNGADATSMALVIARAHRDRRKVLVARKAYHGAAPWNTPVLAGIVPEDRAHIVYFDYNDLDSLRAAADLAGGDLAAVFATPYRMETFVDQTDLSAEYARGVRALCDERDALLVVDDVRAGFRVSRDCSWEAVGVRPDLSAWGKTIANGHPISALLGSDVARRAAERIFVTGSYWFAAVPMAASLATLRVIRETDYLERLTATGEALRAALAEQAASFGFGLRQTGPAAMPMILFEDDPDFRLGYAWCRTAMRAGAYMSPYHNMFCTSAMEEADLARTLEATGAAFEDLRANRASVAPPARVMARLQPRAG